MIMPRGQQLLLPVNPVFMGASLMAALAFNMLPLGRMPWMPDALIVLLAFWGVHQPLRVGMGIAFLLGLCMDVQQSALLGQHALTYVALIYATGRIHRRVLWFRPMEQSVQMIGLFFMAHAVHLLVAMGSGGAFPGMSIFLSPVLEALLWPLASWVLLAPQRRSLDHNENRP